ncbi:HNH endonuclease [Acidimicrobiia bacterium EGI L10123]|uniref:HNH endonuclease signature motif containing protein n=1 Tax=Salinilacustrithrix flava TaxID=2957203 RepID=UPI003D7C2C42|nr:HNH endonuclease [Acidimicrobiia bacterium EGI L10123]
MTGSASYARCADTAASARERLDRAAAVASAMEAGQRWMIAALLELWRTSAWIAAGASSAKAWLLAYTGVSDREAHRLERIAGLCHAHPALADAVLSGDLSLRRTEKLAALVTKERAPFLADLLPALLRLNRRTTDDTAFDEALRFWAARVDEHLEPRRDHPHKLVASQRLFGGGEIHADLTPSAFLNVMSAVDAWTQDPDPAGAPHQRTLAERRADALDDLAHFSLTGHDDTCTDPDDTCTDPDDIDPEDEEVWAGDTFDGVHPTDDLDEALDPTHDDADVADEPDEPVEPVDPMVLLRRRLRRAEQHRRRRVRRRVRARSGVVTNVHIDLRTLSGLRDHDDLDDLILRGEGWAVTKQAAERLLCDSALVATLFAGHNQVLDVNDAAEQFSRRQRRALAARDGHCVFPSCQRPPRFCDAHHLQPKDEHGPTRTDNGALLCRFHHRLVHEHGWTLTIDDTGHWTATDRHGTTWTGRPAHIDPRPGTPPDRSPTHQR